jgi:hypothetical protein
MTKRTLEVTDSEYESIMKMRRDHDDYDSEVKIARDIKRRLLCTRMLLKENDISVDKKLHDLLKGSGFMSGFSQYKAADSSYNLLKEKRFLDSDHPLVNKFHYLFGFTGSYHEMLFRAIPCDAKLTEAIGSIGDKIETYKRQKQYILSEINRLGPMIWEMAESYIKEKGDEIKKLVEDESIPSYDSEFPNSFVDSSESEEENEEDEEEEEESN